MAPRAAAGEVTPFNDDILEEIFIRLRTLEDLGRACASCPAFRRIITSRSFLRRLHALRPPSLLGFHSHSCYSVFHPAEPPHPSAPAARAVAEAADFKFSFLHTRERGSWTVCDGRDGRFVLNRYEGLYSTRLTTIASIAVCDPLFRRYQLVPPLPEDLATAGRQLLRANGEYRHDVFLAPCSEEAEGAFSVIWMARSITQLIAFIFSSASGQWREIASRSWHDLNPTVSRVLGSTPLWWRSYAYGCFYWYLSDFHFCGKLIVLDMGRMDFYTVNCPSKHPFEEVAVVELGENRHGMFVLIGSNHSNDEFIVRLFSASSQIHGEGATEWVLENTVSLSVSSNFSILGVADGKLLLHGAREHNSEEEYGCISLDFKTGPVQRLRGMIYDGFSPRVVQYIGYPPSLSLPTI